MGRSRFSGRVLRWVALTALVATPLVVLTGAGSAGAAAVGDQDALEDAFEDDGVTQIDLTANIVIDSAGNAGCDHFDRSGGLSLVIDGHGFSIVKNEADCAANADEGERIFHQQDDGPITFQNVVVSGAIAHTNGAALYAEGGLVTVVNSTFDNNQAVWAECNTSAEDVGAESHCNDPYGGAIYADGPVVVDTSVFSNNLSEAGGGGIFSESNVTVTGSQFLTNSAGSEGECWCSGGGFLALGGADVSGSEISGNQAGCEAYCDGSGGGFWAGNSTSLVASTVSGNTTGCDYACGGTGGGFSGAGFSMDSFAGRAAAEVGAAAADPGEIVVVGSTITGNTATCGFSFDFANAQGVGGSCGSGGGFAAYEADLVSVSQSTIDANQALCTALEPKAVGALESEICGGGGGIFIAYVGEVNVDSSTLSANTATIFGGALATSFATDECAEAEPCDPGTDVTLVNSTVTANATGEAAAVFVAGEGDTLTLVHDTIVANVIDLTLIAPLIEATVEEVALPASVFTFDLTSFGTIVAQPMLVGELPDILVTVTNCNLDGDVPVTTSQGYNFSDDESCGFDDPTDIVAMPNDPELEVLANYGGPTSTMRPMGEISGTTVVSLSPVVDRIPAAECVLDVDQRGVSRPQTVVAEGCDIGSVEITAEEITISPEIVAITPRFTG